MRTRSSASPPRLDDYAEPYHVARAFASLDHISAAAPAGTS